MSGPFSDMILGDREPATPERRRVLLALAQADDQPWTDDQSESGWTDHMAEVMYGAMADVVIAERVGALQQAAHSILIHPEREILGAQDWVGLLEDRAKDVRDVGRRPYRYEFLLDDRTPAELAEAVKTLTFENADLRDQVERLEHDAADPDVVRLPKSAVDHLAQATLRWQGDRQHKELAAEVAHFFAAVEKEDA